jgi:hypothetical protein
VATRRSLPSTATRPWLSSALPPIDVLEAYVDAYNAGDLEALVSMFWAIQVDEPTIVGHPGRAVASGTDQIREVLGGDVATAAASDAYEVTDVQVDGRRVTFGDVKRDRDGTCSRGSGHTIVVVGGTIESLTFGEVGLPCE